MLSRRLQLFADRLPGAARRATVRDGWAPALAGAVEVFGSPIRSPRAVSPPGLVARAMRTLRDIYALARHAEPRGASERRSETALDSAEATAAVWRHRAEEAEARAGVLETRLADAESTALDLRSRLICLQGKLAATHATARYQSLALALDHGRRDEGFVPDASRRRPD